MKKEPAYKRLDESYLFNIEKAAPLHDIGKMKTPDEILSKKGRLTPEEFEIIKEHTTNGAYIIEKATQNTVDKDFAKVAYNIVKYHHERWDGSGYPCGLRGWDIPLEARIMAIADVYDALISVRPYKGPMPKEEAIELIQKGRDSQFDPYLVDIFMKISKDI